MDNTTVWHSGRQSWWSGNYISYCGFVVPKRDAIRGHGRLKPCPRCKAIKSRRRKGR